MLTPLEDIEIPISVVVMMLASTAGIVAWIEKRFRDARREMGVEGGVIRDMQSAGMAAHAAGLAEATDKGLRTAVVVERLERETAAINREVAQIRLEVYKNLQRYATKADLREMVSGRFDRLEERMDQLLGGKGGGL